MKTKKIHNTKLTIDDTKQSIIDLYHRTNSKYGVWGWSSLDKAGCIIDAIDEICQKREDPVCVEVGVYGGKSLIPAALELKRHSKGIIHGIDPWSNEEATKQYDGAHLEWWSNVNLTRIYNIFIETISNTDTKDYINIIKKASDDAPDFDYIDYLYIDGQHTEQAFRDSDKYATKIRTGGYCFIDDINWGVLQENNLPKYIESLGFEFVKTVDFAAIYRKIDIKPIINQVEYAEAQNTLWIVDDFYSKPNEIRQFALEQDYHIGGIGRGYIGNRTHQQFLFPGLKERFESIMGRKITRWEDWGMNGRFQYCWSGQPQVWHNDCQMWGGMIYLTPNAPYDYGTSLYANKDNKARNYKMEGWNSAWQDVPGDPHLDGSPFEVVDVSGNVFNRLVIFDASNIHASSGYFGTVKENCRLWQMFFFDTEW